MNDALHNLRPQIPSWGAPKIPVAEPEVAFLSTNELAKKEYAVRIQFLALRGWKKKLGQPGSDFPGAAPICSFPDIQTSSTDTSGLAV